ncbi:MAG TPA: alpha/beta hydrolase [Candidatus Saccharimonadales bacterium]|nr:alpha/beta hydrolase [Candidatus Saccharimonadales bacterium]
MQSAILLHGKPDKEEYYDPAVPSCSNHHWFPWLQKQLLVHGIHAQTPEVPDAWNPQYALWQREFERFGITPKTLLVGHSCGGGFLVRWLSEHPDVRVGKAVLVAPSLGIDWDAGDFFNFTIGPQLAARTAGLVIFESDDDRPAIHEAVKKLRAGISGVRHREFQGHGHFTLRSMGTTEFPELLEELLAP